jgi:phosphoribosylformimino-5-aminoimidazole carboxamide ribotide isomerase
LEKLASQTNLSIDFGVGVKSDEDINSVFNAGAQQVTAGSIAVKSPETVLRWVEKFGAERIILGADVKNNKIATHGWTATSDQELIPFILSNFNQGIQNVICTDISKDGMLEGTSESLYAEILGEIPKIQLIASGGLRSVDELYRLKNMGIYGTIIGKALYENKIALKDLEQFILNN